jgi:hypothetical protein
MNCLIDTGGAGREILENNVGGEQLQRMTM